MPNARDEAAADIMREFARDTGLTSGDPPRRYLWTDAFAVCSALALHQRTDDDWLNLALRLVDQVHRVLGRHRDDDPREGWISGLDEEEGAAHPTAGGLRIGKQMMERGADEPHDRRREWDRDGQYFHYLTKWMHALHRVSQETDDDTYRRWAVKLAQTAHAAFTYRPSPRTPKRTYWKMSIDLSRPLVASMGQHDPLDGLITYHELEARSPDGVLAREIADMADICTGRRWATDDPLGLGGLLTDAYRIAQLTAAGHSELDPLLERLLRDVHLGLDSYASTNPLNRPVETRLAFRELGLSIGLHAAPYLRDVLADQPGVFAETATAGTSKLAEYVSLRDVIERTWREAAHSDLTSWAAHRDINAVMLATSLVPEGYLRV